MVLITIPVILVLGILVAAAGCSSQPGSAAATGAQVVTVQSGNITTAVAAAGNLALSETEDLPIDLFYREGTIGEVLVEAGDTVQKGQVLVRVDPDEWADELGTLEDQVTTQARTLTQARANLLSAQQTLANLKDTITKQKAVLSARVSLDTAQKTLDTSISAVDFEAAVAALNKARVWYDYVNTTLKSYNFSTEDWTLTQENAKDSLDIAQANYDMALSGYNSQDVALKKKQVEIARLTLESAEKDLENVPQAIALQEIQVELVEGRLADAEKALADARNDLEEARGKSPEIKAPFDGFVAKVNVLGGDEVLNGTVAVQVADPNKFEAEIMVSEMDILQINMGTRAQVSVSAMSGIVLPAQVTNISPTATIQSGVVNYTVTVEVQSTPAAGFPAASGNATPGTRFQPGQARAPTGQGAAAAPSNIQLKEGLTVTVSLIVAQKNNVLLVPNAAIASKGGRSYVEVMLPNNATEQRAIQAGISDWQRTEVTSGLSEGEKVVVQQGTTTTATTSASAPRPPGVPFMVR